MNVKHKRVDRISQPHLPQLPASRPIEPRLQARLLHLSFDSGTEQQAEHGQQEQGYNKLVPGRVPL